MAKETKEVVQLLMALGEASGKSAADHEISLDDALFFFDAARKVGPAISDISLVPAELAAWGPEDTAELAEVAADFDIPQEKAEAIVKDALKLAGPFIEFLAHFRHHE